MNEPKTLDFTYAKNALFVRQSVAVAFGIPLDRELTWDYLRERICDPGNAAIPQRLLLIGLPTLSTMLPEESRMFSAVLKELRTLRPDIEILVELH